MLFERWPRFATRRPRLVLGITAAAVLVFGLLYGLNHGSYGDAFSLPGAESQRLVDLLKERFPSRAGDSAYVVVSAANGVDSQDTMDEVKALQNKLETLPQVVSVSSPYETPGSVSADRTIAFLNVQYSDSATRIQKDSVHALVDMVAAENRPGFQVEAGGSPLRRIEMEPPGAAEAIGLTAAAVILLIAFGSVVAMGLPIAVALIALTSGFFLVGFGAQFVELPSFTPQFSAMIGIGVGIDYALLITSRFREGLRRGLSVPDSIGIAAQTAGRSVLFAGTTVVIALLGLWAAGMPAVGWVGTGSSLVVGLSVVAALIVLPAILALVGHRIDRWQIPFLPSAASTSEDRGLAYKWSRFVQRNPIPCLIVSLGLLLVAAAPVVDLQLGTSDAGNNPPSFTSRRAYDLLARGFGPGFTGPIIVGFSLNDHQTGLVNQEAAVLAQMPNVAAVTPPSFSDDQSAAVLTVIPRTSPQDTATVDLVHQLREKLRTDLASEPGVEPLVGGATALFADVGARLSSRMPFFFAGVIGLSFILLMAVFRSVVVAFKAAVMNLLSIGASFGLLVAIFQWGWLGSILGVHRAGPIESFMPMTLFAVLFGLSMDYEVFLVSRIREEYLRTGDNSDAVARGLSVTSRVISAAAAIMIAVFLAFAVSDQRIVKEFGIGLAVAIFLDATLVRLVLVPSLMQLMGKWNWWFPSWLDRIVPRISIDDRGVGVAAASPVITSD
jgi:RND superfamily putative drug exporter